MKFIQFPAVLFLLIMVAVSCKKKDKDKGNTPIVTPVSHDIKTVDYYDGMRTFHYRIVYNAQNKVDSIIETTDPIIPGATGNLPSIYSDSGYTVLYNIGGMYFLDSNTFKIVLNENGMITWLSKGNKRGADTLTYKYNDTTEVVEFNIKNGIVHSLQEHYYWQDGDLIGYTYDTAKWQQGDYLSIQDFLKYGRPIFKTKHLVTGISNNPGPHIQPKYIYRFDSVGRISQMLIPVISDKQRYTYTY
jgi:hypothetical protein